MPESLSVNPDGLDAAAAVLNEQASQLIFGDDVVPAGTQPSSAGAASVSAAIAKFTEAYAGRLADRGQSAEMAGASYGTVDDDGAAGIGSVSV